VCRPEDLDHEVTRLLRGGTTEEARGVDLIHEHYRRPVCFRARKRFPSLSAEELADGWLETLVGIVKMARRGTLQPGKPLAGLLHYIMRCRCTETLRRRVRRREVSESELTEPVPVTDSGVSALLTNEAFDLLWQAIENLPSRQRQVWEAYARLGLVASITELTAETSAATGEELSETAVRRALQEGRHTIREFFRRKGYDSDR
jgi:RNA polymerase sigma factor (sigma-70 family)